mmetsp:Transcript_14821/g.48939  ORF Transcript_14821/g.48939 Transcript_14821/m.48939 type:complete len:263 (+) Transcript_14821:1199-1987(+)
MRLNAAACTSFSSRRSRSRMHRKLSKETCWYLIPSANAAAEARTRKSSRRRLFCVFFSFDCSSCVTAETTSSNTSLVISAAESSASALQLPDDEAVISACAAATLRTSANRSGSPETQSSSQVNSLFRALGFRPCRLFFSSSEACCVNKPQAAILTRSPSPPHSRSSNTFCNLNTFFKPIDAITKSQHDFASAVKSRNVDAAKTRRGYHSSTAVAVAKSGGLSYRKARHVSTAWTVTNESSKDRVMFWDKASAHGPRINALK